MCNKSHYIQGEYVNGKAPSDKKGNN